jgi:hypothetical protein
VPRKHRPITTVGITTADRPELLERCLRSLTRQVGAHPDGVRIIVVDSSTTVRNESRGRATVSSIRRATGYTVSFIGRKEKVALRQALRTLSDDSLLQFAFQPGAAGNRNIILLLTSGENVLLVDDDIVCDVWRPRSFRRAITLGGHLELRDIAFYRRRVDVCERLLPATVDLLSAHETVLGRSVRSLVTGNDPAVETQRACPRLRAAVHGARPALVRLTFTGIAGDAGVTYPDRFLFSAGTWKTVLAASRRSFETAFRSREVCKVGNRYIIMHEFSCMGACLGLSNTSVAPPFLPVGRNEDGLFGATLSAIDRQTVGCHLPYAVVHASARSPRYAGGRFPSTSETRTADLLIALISSWAPKIRANDSRRRLISLGHWLRDLAALRRPDFAGVTSLATLRTRERELSLIESALADRNSYPTYWRRDLGRYQAMLLKNADKRSFLLPLEFHRARTINAGYDEFRTLVRSASELYAAWPALWTTARNKLRGFAE